MRKITGIVRSYAWGSRTALASLRGAPTPALYPEAELWFGAHPSAPSLIEGTQMNLYEYIMQDPQLHLGINRDCSSNIFPFMVKILAAEEPLSLQAHPSLEQAQQGFAQENAAGIPLDASHRNYRDCNPKPEMLIALGDFHLLAGFAPPESIITLFDTLIEFAEDFTCKKLKQFRDLIHGQPDSDGIRAAFTTIITLPAVMSTDLINGILTAGIAALSQPQCAHAAHLRVLLSLGEMYPGDSGVIAAIMLNYLHLTTGQAIFVPAGVVHSYIHGLGVEIQANSDNVLRAGLTAKYVDVPELLKIIDFHSYTADDLFFTPVQYSQAMRIYDVGIKEFSVSTYVLEGNTQFVNLPAGKPLIVVCTQGKVALSSEDQCIVLDRGEGAWISAHDHGVTVRYLADYLADHSVNTVQLAHAANIEDKDEHILSLTNDTADRGQIFVTSTGSLSQ